MSQDAWDDPMFVIQARYPKAVFSHESSLYLLNLANREPSPFSVTLKTGTSSSRLSQQGIRVYKVKAELFGEGITEVRSPSGHAVRAYNAERTICDLFRSRRNIEIQDLQDAVKTYIRHNEKNIPQLMRYAKAFSVDKIVRQYLEVLL
jgi:predicted transcriptional regulator of viral defense system